MKRIERLMRYFPPSYFDRLPDDTALWHETAEEKGRGFRKGARQRQLLLWVRRHMGARLSRTQRAYVELHYFQGLTQRQIAELLKVEPSTVCRGIRLGLRRLQAAAREDGPEGE